MTFRTAKAITVDINDEGSIEAATAW